MSQNNLGQILWTDLTVENAEQVRDFYAAVVGWSFEPVSMGEYDDFMMIAKGQRPTHSPEQATRVVGVCHARGDNAGLPAQWLNYFGVADIEASRSAVIAHDGKLRSDVKSYGASKYCVIEDPAGAVCALYESNEG